MSLIASGWGEGPSARYEELAERFRPTFRGIREGAVARELERRLPADEIAALKALRFGALRVPEAQGGLGATLPELFALLIELSEADSNITQALRGHFGFSEDIVASRLPDRQALWLPRIAAGDITGNAWSEIGDGKVTGFSTSVIETNGVLRLNGRKYYTTGSYLADWIDVGASGAAGERIGATVARHAPGVRVVDDWNGFGQTLTASGTATFEDVEVDPRHIVRDEDRPSYFPAFFQLVHLATLAGIARAAVNDVAGLVSRRRRTYSHANGPVAAQDPQVLAVVGHARGAAYAAGAIVLHNARALQRTFEARRSPRPNSNCARRCRCCRNWCWTQPRSCSTRSARRRAAGNCRSTATGATPARSPRTIRASTRTASSATSPSTGPCRRRSGALGCLAEVLSGCGPAPGCIAVLGQGARHRPD